MLSRGVLLLLFVVSVVSAFGLFSRPAHDSSRPARAKHGSLKLCPPGGASFLDAFNLICPMRRRRRSADNGESSTLGKIMNMCCETGCEFTDIFAICNPFG
ncbi:unnamed protein product [Caenorhabditis bovis]|uniref:Insulin-like domain-containing protein n=1 Tax=Caenorhabditis bovis TaxID=2654633 RepID=A0A8S1EZ05_9PELO|nr:unnamed protein product [Caenorhabditis bovis]